MTDKKRVLMLIFRTILLAGLYLLIGTSELFSQSNKEQILAVREASNAALKSYDNAKVLSYLTDDVLTTTGNGSLLSGKKALAKYIVAGGENKMYWIRSTREIVVNEVRGLAWESGIWHGYDPTKGDDAIVSGNYSAMWTQASGTWKIRSQLFVTLYEK